MFITRTSRFRCSLMAGGVLLAALAATAAQARLAEVAETASASEGLDDIVVTAQKSETNLQRTPIAISVLGSEDLANRSVHSLVDLMNGGTPSLRVAPFATRNSALGISIRGIGPGDSNQPSRDAGVGVYIDGVYLGRSQGLGAALYDIERIEVLKGPQGTLFGRNATGGALSIVTRKPSGEFHLTQTAGISNFDGYRTETHLDLPRFAGFSVKIDGIVSKRGGTVKNPMEGEQDFNQYDRQGLHARVLWEPTSNFSADYGFDIARDATTPYYNQIVTLNPAAPPLPPLVRVEPGRVDVADIGVPLQESIGRTHGHRLTLEWHPLDAIALRSISSYRKLSQSQYDNGGANGIRFVPNGKFGRYSLAGVEQDQYSQELQVIGKLPRIDFVAGLYYYHEKGDDWAWSPNTLQWNADGTAYTRLPSLEAGQQSPYPDRASDAVASSFAIFGQATWTPPVLDDIVHLTAGARYTRDKKHGDLSKVNGANTDYSFETSSSRVDPMFTVAVDATDNVHLYAKWGTAYRAGGANSRSLTYRSYLPEEVQTTELGLKSELFDRHVRVNLAAYSTRYKNQQMDFVASNLNNQNRTTIETVNALGISKIKGVEADITVVPARGLTLTASYAFTDGDIRPAANPFRNNALEQVYLSSTPRNAATGAIDYELPLQGATIRAHLDANAAGRYHSQDAAETDTSFIVNGRLAVADISLKGAAALQLSLWSRNLFNEQHTFYVGSSSFAAAGITGLYNEPRAYGVDATVRF